MSRIQTKTGEQSLATGALTLDLVIGTDTPEFEGDFELCQVMLSSTISITQAIAVRHIGDEGAAYDFVLDSSAGALTDYVFRPTGECMLKRGDTIRLTCANSGTPAATVSAKIQVRKMV